MIGGAFAGMAAAGWLARSFDSVIVLERDIVAESEATALHLLEELRRTGDASIQVPPLGGCSLAYVSCLHICLHER